MKPLLMRSWCAEKEKEELLFQTGWWIYAREKPVSYTHLDVYKRQIHTYGDKKEKEAALLRQPLTIYFNILFGLCQNHRCYHLASAEMMAGHCVLLLL